MKLHGIVISQVNTPQGMLIKVSEAIRGLLHKMNVRVWTYSTGLRQGPAERSCQCGTLVSLWTNLNSLTNIKFSRTPVIYGIILVRSY